MTNFTEETLTTTDEIIDNSTTELNIAVDVTFIGDMISLVATNGSTTYPGIEFAYKGDNANGCDNDGYDVVFKDIPDDEGDVKFTFTLNGGWTFQTPPFIFEPTFGAINSNKLSNNVSIITICNTESHHWKTEFTLEVINSEGVEHSIDPRFGGRRV